MVYLSAYFYKVSELFGGEGGWAPFRVGVGVLIYLDSLPFCKNKPHYNHKTNVQRDSLKMLNRSKPKVSKEKLTRLPSCIRKIFITHFWALRVIYCLFFCFSEQSSLSFFVFGCRPHFWHLMILLLTCTPLHHENYIRKDSC